jgi:agmatine deiminase
VAWLLIPHNVDVATIPNQGNVRTIKMSFDSIWTRDYGPVGGFVDETTSRPNKSRAIVNAVYQQSETRQYDDLVPCQIASNSFRKRLPCRSTSIIMDGGNLMFDGNGGLFTTSITYDWNAHHLTPQQVNQELQAAFGVDHIYSIDYAKVAGSREPADGTGHLDMIVKILAPCVVLVAQAPPSNTEYYSVLNKVADYFSNLQCQMKDGTSSVYQVHRVPGWEDEQGTWFTYTNSLIVNDRVIVPSYSSSSSSTNAEQSGDNQARAVYNRAAPNLTVDFVNSDYIIHLGGAVHCLTREIPRLTRRQAPAT